MLKYQADLKTLAYLFLTALILVIQWNAGFNVFVYILSLYFAVTVAIIAHNHNHVQIWNSRVLNVITDYWITLFYGFPVFAWIPTHNKNHHKFNNREGDYTITYRISERNNLFTLLSYPSISSYFQQSPIASYLVFLWRSNRPKFVISIMQYVALGGFVLAALLIDWKKAILYVIIPQQFALFSVLIFNYIQHVHADEESDYNHSRNFVSPVTNFLLFNNGFHTVHHLRASIHWSETPAAHRKIDHLIAAHLKERAFWPYIVKAYLVGPFLKKFRTQSMRLERIAKVRGDNSG